MESESLVQNNNQRKATSSKNEQTHHTNECNSSPVFEIIDAMLLQQESLIVQQKSALEKMLTEPVQRLQDISIPQHNVWKSEDMKEIIQVTRNIKEMTALLKTKNKCLKDYLNDAYSIK
jgi:hypothetical protein